MDAKLAAKLLDLKKYIAEKGSTGAVIAYSGGVDSTTLAAISHEILGDRAAAVIAQSPTYTSAELKEAKQVAKEIGIKLYITLTDELKNPDFARNPENRCYYCKKELLQKLADFAHKHNYAVVFEGTNLSDLGQHRPGFKAVEEAEDVFSPWVDLKFSKDEIRQVAKRLGLAVHDKPAAVCLASRIPFNEQITAKKLQRIEAAEDAIREIVSVKQLRVRDHNDLARIEVGDHERELFLKVDVMDLVALRLKRLGFKYVAFDLEGYRSGSMLDGLDQKA
ncbi:ATP-dependent sacrificial sulfur transferase LarE [Candidatus Bathyarchaeota archaeon]|nr:ATP-dependent sacrificial sulfur transferase LarE [Candidatus Bathyarchaeota archaeon]